MSVRLCLCATLTLLCMSATAAADPIGIRTTRASVEASADVSVGFLPTSFVVSRSEQGGTVEADSANLDSWSSASASLAADAGLPNRLSVVSSTSAAALSALAWDRAIHELPTVAFGHASTFLTVRFEVPTVHLFTFDGQFRTDPAGAVDVLVEALDSGGAVLGGPLLTTTTFGRQESEFLRSFLIDPGTYQLKAYLAGGAGQSGLQASPIRRSSSYTFTASFSEVDAAPVPEPASFLLLGTGLAGLWGLRRRSGNSETAATLE